MLFYLTSKTISHISSNKYAQNFVKNPSGNAQESGLWSALPDPLDGKLFIISLWITLIHKHLMCEGCWFCADRCWTHASLTNLQSTGSHVPRHNRSFKPASSGSSRCSVNVSSTTSWTQRMVKCPCNANKKKLILFHGKQFSSKFQRVAGNLPIGKSYSSSDGICLLVRFERWCLNL